MKSILLAAVAFASVASAAAPANPTAKYITRTMGALERSTAERPAHVKLLFYGQSIVDQPWFLHVADVLRRRYPTAQIDVLNKAIGGFTSDKLIRTAESDLYPENADLVFLHDYGPTELVRKIVERLRARTTSEIVMWTSHIQSADDPAALRIDRDARSKDLISIAADNHCMMIDLRTKWLRMLADEKHEPGWYLADGTHMKESSGAFVRYGDFIAEDLVYVPDAGVDPLNGTIVERKFPVDSWKGDAASYDFAFDGNRVEATFADERNFWKASPTKVLLDGREMGGCGELFYHDRVSSVVSWMPMVLHVGHDTLPVEETWTLTFLEGTKRDGKPVVYRVDGSVTGFDGIGTSTNDFRSVSGRVTIAAEDFHVWQFDYFGIRDHQPKLEARPGMWTTWRTRPTFTDRFTSYHRPGERVTVVSGCSNGHHVLTFVPAVPGKLPQIDTLTVYRPARVEPEAKPAPVKVIFDTDMLTDFDDVGALACLHALADAGECEILATVSSTRGNASVGAVEVINAYYGRGSLPVGAPKGAGVIGDVGRRDGHKATAAEIAATMERGKTWGDGGHYKYRKMCADYPQWVKHADSDLAPDANDVYRKVLAAQPDHSVVICTVGFLTNLRRLLETKPDAHSPLDGRALVAKKVKRWVAMACAYQKGFEYNSMMDPASSGRALADWPTEVVISDFQYGMDVFAGRAVAEMAGPRNPVKDVFAGAIPSRSEIAKDPARWLRGQFGMAGRSAWDETAVLAAVRGAGSYFNVERGTYRMLGDQGEDEWVPDAANGRHLRLTERLSKADVGRVIDELICRGPKR